MKPLSKKTTTVLCAAATFSMALVSYSHFRSGEMFWFGAGIFPLYVLVL